MPWWVLLLSFAVLHVLAIHGVKWVDGSLPVGEFTQSAFDTFYIVFGLFSYGYLVHASGKAMGRFRPAMEATGEEVEAALQDLKTMPQRVAVIAAVVGGGVGIAALISEPEAFDYATTSVASTIVIGVDSAMSFGMQVLAIVFIIRMLRRIVLLHRRADRVNLFRPDPAHAFASVTAWAGAIVLINAIYSVATDPSILESPVFVAFSLGAAVLSSAAFVVPLLGIRGRLKDQKRELLDLNAARVGEATRAIGEAFDRGELGEIGALKSTLEVFNGETTRIKKASIWPWETSTVRGFAATMLLPVFMWFVTSALGKALDL